MVKVYVLTYSDNCGLGILGVFSSEGKAEEWGNRMNGNKVDLNKNGFCNWPPEEIEVDEQLKERKKK